MSASVTTPPGERIPIPLTVLEPRPCLPAGRLPFVRGLTEFVADRWLDTRPAGPRLAPWLLGVLTFAGLGIFYPASLVAMVGCALPVFRAVLRTEDPDEVLAPYVAALAGTFGADAAKALCAATPTEAADRPTGAEWALASWRHALEAAVGRDDCSFANHEYGCPHRPFRADTTHRHCWPGAFNGWLDAARRDGLVA